MAVNWLQNWLNRNNSCGAILCIKMLKRERKSSQVFACACLCLVWPPTCDDLWWLATNLSLFKFHRKFFSTCESLRIVWTQNTSRCKSFLPARALELAEVSELYIEDSIYRVHWRKFRTCDDLCRRLTGGIATRKSLQANLRKTCDDLRSRLIRA